MSNATSAKNWKKSRPQGGELKVPSGNTCLVRKPEGLQAFMAKGMIPNTLLPIIKQALDGKETTGKELAEAATNDKEFLGALFDLADQVVVETVIEPEVTAVPVFGPEHVSEHCKKKDIGKPIPPGHVLRHINENCPTIESHNEDDCECDVLYVDEVDFMDRMFIFNYAVGGPKDLERFRDGQAEIVAAVSASQGVEVSAE